MHHADPQYTMSANGQYPVFPPPQMQPNMHPVIPAMPMHGAIPTAGNPFPAPAMNMPVPEPAMPGAGPEAPVIPPPPFSHRGRAGTPYHPPHNMDSPDTEYTDELTAETRERLQPPLAPGQYGPHDRLRERARTPAPALRRTHRRVESSPVYMRGHSPPFDDGGERPVIPPHLGGGPPFPGLPGQFAQPGMGMGMGMDGMRAGARMEMPQPQPQPETVLPRFPPFERRHNPLPEPPKDILNSSPYARIIRELRKPIDEAAILGGAPAVHMVGTVNVSAPIQPQGYQGTRSSKEKKRKGLFRSLSTRLGGRRHEDEVEPEPDPAAAAGVQGQFIPTQTTRVYPIVQHLPDGSTQLIYNPPGAVPLASIPGVVAGDAIPPPGVMPGYVPAGGPTPSPAPGVHMQMPMSPGPARAATPLAHPPSPIPQPPPPAIKIAKDSELAGLLHLSRHRVHWDHRQWPTGLHLLEAMKLLPDRPDLAERIRQCGMAEEAMAISEGYREYWRRDWDQIAVERAEEVLYTKMMQYPDLRAMLLQTGRADLVFLDPDTYWGDGQIGQGLNKIGHALMNVRERLRAEGVDTQ
ncbi:hypothetical protein C8Q76DRAFT_831599 [Earliella scabrosa]|nr:hypothetical protein C8Q76DRAFT_831599 [Earliella scabrosa]